jgi:hypothetical protein
MRLTEEKLKELFQRQTARSTPRRTECLTEDQFTRAAAGEISSEERRNVARHLITCIDCTQDYRTLRSLQPWAEDAKATLVRSADDLSPSASRGDRSLIQGLRGSVAAFWQRLIWEPRARAVTAVVAIVVLAGSSLIIWQAIIHKEQPASSERAPVTLRLRVEPPDNAKLADPPQKLSWSALERALAYRVVLFDYQSTPIWESARLKETSATLPDSVRQQLLRNQPYYWRVIAEDPIDQRQSELFQFILIDNERR